MPSQWPWRWQEHLLWNARHAFIIIYPISFPQAISSSGKTCSRMPLPKCSRSQSSTQLPLHLGDAIAITLAMTRALHSQQASTHLKLDLGHVNALTVATTIVQWVYISKNTLPTSVQLHQFTTTKALTMLLHSYANWEWHSSTHVSLPKSCHRNDSGDDVSTSC